MAIVKAQLNNVRLAPRKVRLVVNAVKGKGAVRALQQLEFIVRRPSGPVAKLLRSAIANAEHNFNMVPSNLFIKEFYVDEGVKLKRYRAAGFGRPREIQKKTSHIRLVLGEKVAGLKGDPSTRAGAKPAKKTEHVHQHNHDHHQHAGTDSPRTNEFVQSDRQPKMKVDNKPEIKTELGKKAAEPKKGFRKFFQRKSI